jgi:hypothetical protein
MRLNIWNNGWNSTCCGIRLPAVNRIRKATLNRQLNRAQAKATALESRRMKNSEGMTMKAVLPNFWVM